jgi:hypothetical protein
MQSRINNFYFSMPFNFGHDSVFQLQFENMKQPFPPAPGDFLLLDNSNFLLLDGTNFLLL